MMPFPSRDDAAMEMITRACGGSHDFPDNDLRQPTGAEIDAAGRTVNIRRDPCRRCGTVRLTLREVAGHIQDLPPLPAGHGDYRLRFHTTDTRALLQIWNQPRTKPHVLSSAER